MTTSRAAAEGWVLGGDRGLRNGPELRKLLRAVGVGERDDLSPASASDERGPWSRRLCEEKLARCSERGTDVQYDGSL